MNEKKKRIIMDEHSVEHWIFATSMVSISDPAQDEMERPLIVGEGYGDNPQEAYQFSMNHRDTEDDDESCHVLGLEHYCNIHELSHVVAYKSITDALLLRNGIDIITDTQENHQFGPLRHYLFYSTEGYTQQPDPIGMINGCEAQSNNLQVIGTGSGINADDAFKNMLIENPYISDTTFNVVHGIETVYQGYKRASTHYIQPEATDGSE
jgi:hypothetical protein